MPSLVVYGKKGGGKTYYSLRLIIMELVHGDRCVVTNVALRLDELSAYLAKKYPLKNIDVNKRVRILTREETKAFWLHRELGNDLKECTPEEYAKGMNPDYTGHFRGGIFYVIDEIHIDFDARGWARCGPGLTYYNSQERKLLDDQIYITQFLGLVDKRVKGFGQEFIECRNWKYERFLTFFSKGSGMEAVHYAYPPEGSAKALPNEKHSYRIEPDLAACYDTSAGVGFKGPGKADTGLAKKRRGLPMWTMWASVPVLILVLAKGSDVITSHIAGSYKRVKPAPLVRPQSSAEAVPASMRAPAPVGPVVRGVILRDGGLWVSIEGRGWMPVVSRENDFVILGDGIKVPAVDVLAGRTETHVAANTR